jgi:EpsD family peptidyl-prolyl cis-trans isomerase
MKISFATAAALGTALLMAGCGDKAEGELEKGQVVATLDGTDVTIYELNGELQGVRLPADPKQRKLVEQAALQQLLNRKILANIAREQKLDKSSNYLLMERRADEELLVRLLQQNIASQVPKPTSAEISRYMDQNPDIFAQRKLYGIEQIQFPLPKDEAALKAFAPLKTLDEVAQKLAADGIESRRGRAVIDSAATPPALIKQIAALPPGEVFIFPNQGVMTANTVLETKVEPLGGEQATALATNRLMQDRMTATAKSKLDARVEELRANVKYQAGYAPPAKPGAKTAAAK